MTALKAVGTRSTWRRLPGVLNRLYEFRPRETIDVKGDIRLRAE